MIKKYCLYFLFLITQFHASAQSCIPAQEPLLVTNFETLMQTVDGCLVLLGWDEGEDYNYDLNKLTDEEKQEKIKRGLDVAALKYELATTPESLFFFSELLTKYYHNTKNIKKCLYWAHKASEEGSSIAMYRLSIAYMSGNGVVEDIEEGIKWRYLAAALGDESSKLWVDKNKSSAILNEELSHLFKEGRLRANSWMKEHSELFISDK